MCPKFWFCLRPNTCPSLKCWRVTYPSPHQHNDMCNVLSFYDFSKIITQRLSFHILERHIICHILNDYYDSTDHHIHTTVSILNCANKKQRKSKVFSNVRFLFTIRIGLQKAKLIFIRNIVEFTVSISITWIIPEDPVERLVLILYWKADIFDLWYEKLFIRWHWVFFCMCMEDCTAQNFMGIQVGNVKMC